MSLIDFLKEKAQDAVGVEVDVEGRAVVLSPERSEELLVAAIRASGAPLKEHWLGPDRLHFVMTHSSGVQASGEIVEIDLALLGNTWKVTAVLGKPVDVHHEHIVADVVVRLVASLLRAAPDAFGGAKLKETRLVLSCGRVDEGVLGALAALAEESAGRLQAVVTFKAKRLRLAVVEPSGPLAVPRASLVRLGVEVLRSRLQ